MKILILGGTGFLGPHTVTAALARNHTVTLFNRGKTNPGLFPDLEKFHGDRKDPDALKQLAGKQFDAVVDTSGYFPKHVKMSAELLAPNIKQYVFISTISVYADNSRPNMDETAPVGTLPDPTIEKMSNEAYGPLKAYCEQAAEAAMPGKTANIRPGLIVGPDDPTDRFTYWPARLDRGGEVLCPAPASTPIQYIDARDLGEFIVTTVEQGHVGVYNAVGPAYQHTIGDLVHACRAATTSDAHLTWVDTPFVLEHEIQPWMELTVWVPSDGDSAGFSTVNHDKAVSVGLKFRAMADTIRDTLEWSRKRPADYKWRAGLSAEKEKRVLEAWHHRAATKPS